MLQISYSIHFAPAPLPIAPIQTNQLIYYEDMYILRKRRSAVDNEG